ncbi:MAG: alpha-amylase family glycosyl hydrolase, partial [Anaerolineae bacterium]|nr:alpha-amylase family glycosyl hydrolase [Anaerolineae bacterium]
MRVRTPGLGLQVVLAVLVAAGCRGTVPITPTPTLTPAPVSYPAFVPTATPAPLVAAPPWAGDATIYLVLVRSFHDSDGDGIGDLPGLTEKLDYLNDGDPATDGDLGVTAIWLLPIFAAASYHGYDTLDHFAIQPEYGTREDLIRLVEECHRRGIRVILDFVMAHVSYRHPFFVDALGNPASPYSGWFTWYDEAHTRYKAFANIGTVPSLNGEEPAVVEYALQVARHWMDLDGDGDYTDGIDGFRCDHAVGVPHTAWKRLRAEVKRLRPDFLLLGEVWDRAPVIARYYEDEFDSTFDFPLHQMLAGQSETVGQGVLGAGDKPGLVEASLLQRRRLYPWGAQSVIF